MVHTMVSSNSVNASSIGMMSNAALVAPAGMVTSELGN